MTPFHILILYKIYFNIILQSASRSYADGTKKLKSILKIYDKMSWFGFNWLRMGSVGGPS
jgi:hypothetical protein